MKTHFLHKQKDSDELILFFGGFGSDPSHFSHLKSEKNVLMVYDYRHFHFDIDLRCFKQITLIAFSMGVSVAAEILSKNIFVEKIGQKIAINGTHFGIHRQYGIHPILFQKTIEKLDVLVFQKSLFGSVFDIMKDKPFGSQESLKEELKSLFDYIYKKGLDNMAFCYNKALLSESDNIFPYETSRKFFNSLVSPPIIITSHAPHFVFLEFKSWEELCCI